MVTAGGTGVSTPDRPAMPDPARLVRKSVRAAMDAGHLTEYQATIVVRDIAHQMVLDTPGSVSPVWEWIVDVYAEAWKRHASVKPHL